MLNKSFKSRLSKLSSKKEEDTVVQEFVLTHVSEEVVQTFLEPLDEAYETSLRHPFISDKIEWKRILFYVRIPMLGVKFDELEMDAVLVGINVSRKIVKADADKVGEIFKYDLIFHKNHNPDIDSVFAITYLNRREEDEKGKKLFLEYDTVIQKRG
jgi:hypothetical protein